MPLAAVLYPFPERDVSMPNKRLVLAGALASAFAGSGALAAEEPKSPHTVTGNVGVYSQYIFRGLTQTNEEPALQGGLDYSHSSGFYIGAWGSNISWLKENFTSPAGVVAGQYDEGGSLELDLYGGFRGNFGKTDFTYDIGFLYYWYPGDPRSAAQGCVIGTKSCPDADTQEVYAGLGWKWLSAKYYYSLDDTFGWPDSDGTWYLDLSASIPLGATGVTLGLHYGKQEYDGDVPGTSTSYDSFLSYEDWRVSVAYDLGKAFKVLTGVEIGAMYTDTGGADVCGYGKFTQTGTLAGAPCNGTYPTNIADSQATVWLKKTF
jgi:uncharacterized protein (TIGR02001 family)